MGSVEVGGVSLKTWVWSELGLEKGVGAEGKVWRVKQASKGRWERKVRKHWQPGGAGVRAELGGVGSSPEGAHWGQGSSQGGQKGPEWGPRHAATLDSGTGGNSLKAPCNLHPDLASHVPSPLGCGQALAKVTKRPSLLKGREVTQTETRGLLLNVPPPSGCPV